MRCVRAGAVRLLLLLPALLGRVAHAAFDEATARTKLMPLAAAAYTPWPEECVKRVLRNATVIKQYSVPCDDNSTQHGNTTSRNYCSAFIGTGMADKVIFLAFRGTISPVQLAFEAYRTLMTPMVASRAGGRVSAYFYGVYSRLNDAGLMRQFELLARIHPTYRIWVTGHSLGGALAAIAAVEGVKAYGVSGNKLQLVTFGQPRTGDEDFAESVDKYVKYARRVINRNDLVPQAVPRGYMGYTHHQAEVWYRGGMGPGARARHCQGGEDAACQLSVFPNYSVADHVAYFGKVLVTYGLSGCTI